MSYKLVEALQKEAVTVTQSCQVLIPNEIWANKIEIPAGN